MCMSSNKLTWYHLQTYINLAVLNRSSFFSFSGTVEERGIHKMRKHDVDVDDSKRDPTYDLPFIQPFLDKISFLRHLPFCPTYTPLQCNCRKNNLKEENTETHTDGIDNVICEKL